VKILFRALAGTRALRGFRSLDLAKQVEGLRGGPDYVLFGFATTSKQRW
jgi:hypothetical protein